MISLKPFKAIRPTRDKAYLVATRSYLSYSEEELDEKLNNNPYTFLHVINPKEGRKLPFGRDKYKLVKETFHEFEEAGVFMQDPTPAYYMYRQVKEGNEYIGLIAAVAVADYVEGRIKKHEKTLTQRERLFADYLEETGFNAEPVLLTYQDDLRLNKIYARHIAQRSEYEFTSTDRVLHQLWLIDSDEEKVIIEQVFAEQEALYIADGHHRSASSATLAKRAKENQGTHAQYFMAFLIGEEQMKVYEFNRLVKGLNGLSKAQFLEQLQTLFLVEQVRQELYKPEKLHEMGMYLQGEWYKLVPRTGTFDPRHPVEHLDAQILSKNILKPLLGILNLKTDTRVSFLPGNEGVKGLMKAVDNGKFDVAFALYPISVEQIKSVADAKKTMPPKSTYIEPKLRSGLIVYKLAE
jgi:uncharacterized protein (DUF1015 family)